MQEIHSKSYIFYFGNIAAFPWSYAAIRAVIQRLRRQTKEHLYFSWYLVISTTDGDLQISEKINKRPRGRPKKQKNSLFKKPLHIHCICLSTDSSKSPKHDAEAVMQTILKTRPCTIKENEIKDPSVYIRYMYRQADNEYHAGNFDFDNCKR